MRSLKTAQALFTRLKIRAKKHEHARRIDFSIKRIEGNFKAIENNIERVAKEIEEITAKFNI